MSEKRGDRENSHGESYGVAGFTLGIAGFVSLITLVLPVYVSFGLIWIFTFAYFITGLVFCRIQQKRNKTAKGKKGLWINIIGLVLTVIVLIVVIAYMIYNLPALLQSLEQTQTFPTA